jgi:hypothetical protein
MPWRVRMYYCEWCKWHSRAFYEDSRLQEVCYRGLQNHMQVVHTCEYCGAVMRGWRLPQHKENCKRMHEAAEAKRLARICPYCGWMCSVKSGKKKKHVEACKLRVACEAMLLICLAGTEPTEATPIATLTDDVLQCVFKHVVQVD